MTSRSEGNQLTQINVESGHWTTCMHAFMREWLYSQWWRM